MCLCFFSLTRNSVSFLDTRSYDGTPISRRTTDGYVNATAMCKAGDKRWTKYRESDRANEYLEALSTEVRISVFALIDSKRGGLDGGETWVHPQVAVDLARWISAPFAVWMDGWFLEEAGNPVSAPQPVPVLPSQTLATVREAVELLKILGGVDDRSQQILRDVVINATVEQAGGSIPAFAPSEKDDFTTLAEYLKELGCPAHKATPLAAKRGRAIKQCWRDDHGGEEPKSVMKYVNGEDRPVALYPKAWLNSARESFQKLIEDFTK